MRRLAHPMPLILALAPLVATIKVLTFHHVALSETKAMPRAYALFRQPRGSSNDKECVNSGSESGDMDCVKPAFPVLAGLKMPGASLSKRLQP